MPEYRVRAGEMARLPLGNHRTLGKRPNVEHQWRARLRQGRPIAENMDAGSSTSATGEGAGARDSDTSVVDWKLWIPNDLPQVLIRVLEVAGVSTPERLLR